MGKRDISYESWLQMRNGTETGNYFNLTMYVPVLQLAPPWFVITYFSQIRSIEMRSPSLLSQCLAGLLSHDRTAAHCVNIVPEREPHLPSPAVEIVPSKVPPLSPLACPWKTTVPFAFFFPSFMLRRFGWKWGSFVIYWALTNLTFITLVCRMCIHTSMPVKILNCTEWIYSRCLFFSQVALCIPTY